MHAMQTEPNRLRTAVHRVVAEGAWAPADIVASVASDSIEDRRAIIATLWDLVSEGVLTYDATHQFPGFRPAV